MGIREIVLKLEEIRMTKGSVEFINEENRNYAFVSFENSLSDPTTAEVQNDCGYVVVYFLPGEEYSRKFGADDESYNEMILSIYEAEKDSYLERQFDKLLELAQIEGPQSISNFVEGLKVDYSDLLESWVFEYPNGFMIVEDDKQLASNRIGDFYCGNISY